MVGSVLMHRMRDEGDFALIEPVFFSTCNAGGDCGGHRRLAKNERRLHDATDLAALARCDVVITCQGGDYTTEVCPAAARGRLEGLLDRRGLHAAHEGRRRDHARPGEPAR
jgi:aspartate-semialdehyde dehydrogenase